MAWGLPSRGDLASAGCDLMLNGIGIAPDFAATCREIAADAGVSVHCTEADLSSGDEVARLVAAAEAEIGGVDILINNAVVRHFAPIVDFPTDKWDAALAVNLSAAFHAIRSVLPGMRARNFGRIFNITSVYGVRGTAGPRGAMSPRRPLCSG